METAVFVALIAGGLALVTAIVSAVLNRENARAIENIRAEHSAQSAADERMQQIAIYSEPLARAAFDLQSRLYNILRQDFARRFLVGGNEREREYVLTNTTFLISQFFCWSELTRTEIHFIDLGDLDRTRELLRLQDEISSTWGTDRFDPAFRIFAGEQRAIGEALIVGEREYTTCAGYGSFLRNFALGNDQYIDYLRSEVLRLPATLESARARLSSVQHLLVGIVGLIDPEGLRFPERRRSRA